MGLLSYLSFISSTRSWARLLLLVLVMESWLLSDFVKARGVILGIDLGALGSNCIVLFELVGSRTNIILDQKDLTSVLKGLTSRGLIV